MTKKEILKEITKTDGVLDSKKLASFLSELIKYINDFAHDHEEK